MIMLFFLATVRICFSLSHILRKFFSETNSFSLFYVIQILSQKWFICFSCVLLILPFLKKSLRKKQQLFSSAKIFVILVHFGKQNSFRENTKYFFGENDKNEEP
jgi:hypothetical protein